MFQFQPNSNHLGALALIKKIKIVTHLMNYNAVGRAAPGYVRLTYNVSITTEKIDKSLFLLYLLGRDDTKYKQILYFCY